MKSKILSKFSEAVRDIPDGAVVMMHSFSGSGGIAQNLIVALRDQGARNLTIIACNTGLGPGIYQKAGLKPFVSPNMLIESGQVKKVISCLASTSPANRQIGDYSPLEQGVLAGTVDWEPCPPRSSVNLKIGLSL